MSAMDYYSALGLARGCTAEDIKRAFRALAMKFHPDRNRAPGAEERFKQIAEAHEVLSDPERRVRYDRTGSAQAIVVTSRAAKYEIERRAATGDVGDVYRVRSSAGFVAALKVARSPADADLMAREWDALKALHPPGSADDKARRYFPPAVETFKVDDGKRRQATVTRWLDGYVTLAEVQCAYGVNLPIEHASWIFNRVLEALHYAHEAGIVHGAVTPQHVMVYAGGSEIDPLNHGARLVGWTFSTKIGGKVPAAPPEPWRWMCAPEILTKRAATPATDIYMAALCVQYALGASVPGVIPDRVPTYLRSFLRGCALISQSARPQQALELHQEFKEHMRKHYGPKKYVPFRMPPSAATKGE